jgi:hypothetical protein
MTGFCGVSLPLKLAISASRVYPGHIFNYEIHASIIALSRCILLKAEQKVPVRVHTLPASPSERSSGWLAVDDSDKARAVEGELEVDGLDIWCGSPALRAVEGCGNR